MTNTATNLAELLDAMRTPSGLAGITRGIAYKDGALEYDWSSLPNFGGPAPDDTAGVWSWDETHLLIGEDPASLEIVSRA